MNADHLAPRKNLRENIQRYAIVGIVKGGNQYQAVRNIKVRVTGRKTLATKDYGARHRQFDQVELPAVKSASSLEPF